MKCILWIASRMANTRQVLCSTGQIYLNAKEKQFQQECLDGFDQYLFVITLGLDSDYCLLAYFK